MRWQCALLQRWLPEYPDGDLPAFWKARLRSHLEHCPTCRQELVAMGEVVKAIKAAPVPDPGEEFWSQFSRELHLKLAHAAHESPAAAPAPAARRFRLPYLVGVPVLAVLILWVATYLSTPESPVLTPPPQLAQQAAPGKAPAKATLAETPKSEMAKAPATTRAPAPPVAEEPQQFAPASLEENGALAEDDLDLSNDDLDSVLAGMTDQEKEKFLKKLHQQEKNGSCLEGFSSTSLA